MENTEEPKRWRVVTTYRSQTAGLVPITHEIEELEELQEIIERGPDWNSLEEIKVTLARHLTDNGSNLEETEDLPLPGSVTIN